MEEKKKRQTRGGKGVIKAKKKTEPQGLKLSTATRGKKKRVTIIAGLATYGKLCRQELLFFGLGNF